MEQRITAESMAFVDHGTQTSVRSNSENDARLQAGKCCTAAFWGGGKISSHLGKMDDIFQRDGLTTT